MKRTLLLLLFAFLVACSGTESTPEPTAAPTEPSPTETSIPPTETPAPPTETPAPPTETPVPPTPTAEPTEAPAMLDSAQLFDDEALGFSMSYPEGWISESLFGLFTLFASDAEVMEADAIDGEAAAILIAAPSDGTSVEEIFEQEADIPDNAEMLVEPESVTIDGRDGLHATAQVTEDGDELYADIYAIEGEGAIYLITFVTDPASAEMYAPIFTAMVDSIQIGTADLSALENPFGDLDLGGEGEAVDGGALALDTSAQLMLNADTTYTLDVVAEETYIIVAAGREDVVLKVSDMDGNELASADESFAEEPEIIVYSAESDTTLNVTLSTFSTGGQAIIGAYTPVASATDAGVTVEVTEGTVPLVIVQPSEDLDPMLVVGETAIDNDSTGSTEMLLMSDYEVGSYDATVEIFSGEGSYEIIVANINSEFGNAGSLVTELLEPLGTIELETSTSVVLGDAGYTFTIPDESVYIVMGTGDDDTDIRLALYDANSRAAGDTDRGFRGETELLVINGAAGDYTVVASNFSGDNGTGRVSVRKLQTFDGLSSTLPFTLSEEGDNRPILFAIAQSDSNSDVAIEITNEAGGEVATIDDAFEDLEWYDTLNLPAGDYTATASYFYEEGAPIMGLIEPDDSFARDVAIPESADLQALAVGDVVEANTESDGYTLNLTGETPVVLLARSADGDMTLAIYDENNVEVDRVDQTGGGSAEYYAFMQAGVYTVVPAEFFESTVDYTISVLEMQPADSGSVEFTKSADTVTLLYAVPGAETEADVVLAILDADGNEVDSYDWRGSGEAESVASNDLDIEDGTYTAQASVYNDGEGEVNLLFVELSGDLFE